MNFWKLTTYDLRPPIQGGEAIWDGSLPFTLPETALDTSASECGAGWNFTQSLGTAVGIVGLWPNGRPSRAFLVEPGENWVERGSKCRASVITVVREATGKEVADGIRDFSLPLFGNLTDEMVAEQLAWRAALSRLRRDAQTVVASLEAALDMRGVKWKVRQFKTAKDACFARDARDARAWNCWVATQPWDARRHWDAKRPRDARAANAAWDTKRHWDAKQQPGAANAAWDASAALVVHFAARSGWTTDAPTLLSAGLRDAYAAGAEIVFPTGRNELGFAMAGPDA